MIQYGVITQYRYTTFGSGKKLEVKVSVDDRVTNWLLVKTQASSFLTVHTPVRIGDQVAVLNPYGNNEDGFVVLGLIQEDIPLPSEADENTLVALFEDGTKYKHDAGAKEISIDTPCSMNVSTKKDVTLTCDANVNVECKSSTVKASEVTLDSSSINLGKGGKGVITEATICPYTGSPHTGGSTTVKATA